MVPEIPDDIIDLILEEVGNKLNTEGEERLTLQACLFVSKAFRHFALARLFFHTVISNRCLWDSSYLSILRQVLTPLPNSDLEHVDRHIGILTIGFLTLEDFHDTENAEHVQQYKDLLNNPDLVYILDKVHQKTFGIQRLLLDFSQTSNGIKWTDFTPELQAALRSLMSSPFLKIVDIASVNLLPTDFLASSKVSTLRLQRLTPYVIHRKGGRTPERKLDIMDPPPELKTLISDNTYLYKPAQRLTALELDIISSLVAEDSLDLVKSCSGTIENLDIRFSAVSEKFKDIFPSFHLDLLPNLKTFQLSEHHAYPSMSLEKSNSDPLPFYNVLDVSTPMEFLTEIKMTYWYKFHRDDYIDVERLASWERLDRLLTGPMYPALKTISIAVHARVIFFGWDFMDHKGSDKLTDCILQLFPRLSKSGKKLALKISR